MMRLQRTLLLSFLAAVAAAWIGREAESCEGTIRPACGKSNWVVAMVDESFVHPGNGADIIIPVRVFPYATWNSASTTCAQPVGTQLAMAVFCTPADGGPEIALPAQVIPIAIPSEPGVQPLLTGDMGAAEIGGPFDYTITAGILPAGTSYRCRVLVEYQVNFALGTGPGPIQSASESRLCIVDPSDTDPSKPALEMRRLLSSGANGLDRCRRGDQAVTHYLLANNDATQGVSLTFAASSDQVARLPASADGDEFVFAISSPKKKTDNFPLRFFDINDPGAVIPEGNPLAKSTQSIDREIYLGPGEVRIVSVMARSHGMCADGSCCALLAEVDGKWDDGSPALACAGSALMVDNVDGTTPLVEIQDDVKVADDATGIWSELQLDKDPLLAILAAGNVSGGTLTTGDALAQDDFPSTVSDYLRTTALPNRADFKVSSQSESGGFADMKMKVTIKNLAAGTSPIAVPLLTQANGADFKLTIDAAAGTATLIDKKKKKSNKLFDGAFSDLLANPPTGVAVDKSTCRTLSWTTPDSLGYLSVIPGSFWGLFDSAGTPDGWSAVVVDPRDFNGSAWTAMSDNLAVGVMSGTGMAGDDLVLVPSLSDTATFPDVSLSWITVDSVGAINAPFLVPVASRQMVGVAVPGPLVVSDVSGKIRLTGDDAKDKLTIEGQVSIDDPSFKIKKQRAVFQILGQDFLFTFDKKGKSTGNSKEASLAIAVPKNLPGNASFTLKLKKQDLSAGLVALGVHKDLPSGVVIPIDLPVVGRFFDTTEIVEATVSLVVEISPDLVAELDSDVP